MPNERSIPGNALRQINHDYNWWWWIVFAEWLTDKKRLALFPDSIIVSESRHGKFRTRWEKDSRTQRMSAFTVSSLMINELMEDCFTAGSFPEGSFSFSVWVTHWPLSRFCFFEYTAKKLLGDISNKCPSGTFFGWTLEGFVGGSVENFILPDVLKMVSLTY